MYQFYNLINSEWVKSGKPFTADSRRRAIAYVRALGNKGPIDLFIRHEGTFKVAKV